jgi:hypothetical protein
MESSSSSRHSEDWGAYRAWRGPQDGTWRTAEDELTLLLRLRRVQAPPDMERPRPAPVAAAMLADTTAPVQPPIPTPLWYAEVLAGLALCVAGFGLMVIGGASAVASGAWVAWFLALCGFSVAASGTLFIWRRCVPRRPVATRPARDAAQVDARRPRRPSNV